MVNRNLALVVHNVRSCHNVGSLLRSADCLGVEQVLLTGYTPFPAGAANDPRLPHEITRADRQIQKTALGAEASVTWKHMDGIGEAMALLRKKHYSLVALEQTEKSHPLTKYRPQHRAALIVGSEVGGLPKEVLSASDLVVEIPMLGKKDSLNVSVAAAIALHHLRFA